MPCFKTIFVDEDMPSHQCAMLAFACSGGKRVGKAVCRVLLRHNETGNETMDCFCGFCGLATTRLLVCIMFRSLRGANRETHIHMALHSKEGLGQGVGALLSMALVRTWPCRNRRDVSSERQEHLHKVQQEEYIEYMAFAQHTKNTHDLVEIYVSAIF